MQEVQELENRIDEINAYYLDYYMNTRAKMLERGFSLAECDALMEVFTKANDFDVFKAKCSKGAKHASRNMSKKQRIDRARAASDAKKKKAEKEKARRHQAQIDKHRI